MLLFIGACCCVLHLDYYKRAYWTTCLRLGFFITVFVILSVKMMTRSALNTVFSEGASSSSNEGVCVHEARRVVFNSRKPPLMRSEGVVLFLWNTPLPLIPRILWIGRSFFRPILKRERIFHRIRRVKSTHSFKQPQADVSSVTC